jgi:DNA-binding response OmpR family regulator
MPKKILSVENEIDTANLIKHILEREGYQVDIVFDGGDAMKKLEKETYDLVLLDVMMADMSGWDVFEKIKKEYKDKTPKIAFLSVMEMSPDRIKRLKKEGVVDYINKPFKVEELVHRVKTILGDNNKSNNNHNNKNGKNNTPR